MNTDEIEATVTIPLNATLSSDLHWKAAEEAAEKYVQEGYRLLWNLDLGLFNRLQNPLSNQSQFLSFVLSLEHLRDTLWKKYQERSLGVCLYEGSANFYSQMVWDDQMQSNYLTWGAECVKENFNAANTNFKCLFSRDSAAEYLTLLANRMPDAMPLFLSLSVDPSLSISMEAQLTHRARFERFHLIIKEGRLPSVQKETSTIGVCLPEHQCMDLQVYSELETIFLNLLKQKKAFRVIPEAFLMNEWAGLDYLIVHASGLSAQGRRKLQGFSAASGIVVAVGGLLNLSHEIPYGEFLTEGHSGVIWSRQKHM